MKIRRPTSRQEGLARRGAILVWFALVLPLLLGMTGLVIDAGFLMASHRHVQNSVDSAALAAADDLVRGKSTAEAIQTATDFVQLHYRLEDAAVEVYTPPQSGPYAGVAGYVEVLANYKTPTLFVHLLPGGPKSQVAGARAVAGAEDLAAIDGVIALDPNARPGLAVTGNAQLKVTGRIIVNSEGGGVDAQGTPINNGNQSSAAFVSGFSLVTAKEVYVVGGVNREDRFASNDPNRTNPLKTGQLPVRDPFRYLPTPTVANGVINVRRGAPNASDTNLALNNAADDSGVTNTIVTDQATGKQTMVLRPGIYSSINIAGGSVRFEPGIYVLAAPAETTYSLQITGGKIEARGVMFYNSTETYDPITGQPDAFDGELAPTAIDKNSRQIQLNANLGFTPIDTLLYPYPNASPLISQFNGMLIYQRRSNTANVQIQGFSGAGDLKGTVYAKWADVRLPAGGVFNSQFVVGTLKVPGHGDLTIDYDRADVVKAPQVFLVE